MIFQRGNDTVQIIALSNQKPGILTNYIRIKYGNNCRFNASPVNSICDHQISIGCREIFKYNIIIF
jgi:hypothetical protein